MIVQLWNVTTLLGTADVPVAQSTNWPPATLLWRGQYYGLIIPVGGGGDPGPGPHFLTYQRATANAGCSRKNAPKTARPLCTRG
jgi:hypothetical protein